MNIVVARFAAAATISGPKCPRCDESTERIHRTLPMRVLIGSRRYYCRFCRRDYLQLGKFLLPLRP